MLMEVNQWFQTPIQLAVERCIAFNPFAFVFSWLVKIGPVFSTFQETSPQQPCLDERGDAPLDHETLYSATINPNDLPC
jgi:hypothetical protein